MASWTSAPAPPVPPPATGAAERGIVHRGASADLFDLLRSEVGPNLAPFAQHLWEVRWDRRGGPPRSSQTIPFPSVNLTVEDGTPSGMRHGHRLPAALVHGVVTRTFRIALDGAGWACGVKFRPGAFLPFLGEPVNTITDVTLPADPILRAQARAFAQSRLAVRRLIPSAAAVSSMSSTMRAIAAPITPIAGIGP